MSLEQMFDARSWIESQKFGSEIEIQMKYFCLYDQKYRDAIDKIIDEQRLNYINFDELIKKLDENTQSNSSLDYKFDEKDFRLTMLEDQMASEKLSEGITGFSKAIEELEELLLKRFSEINKQKLISAT